MPGIFTLALAAFAATGAVALGVVFGLGIFPLEGRTLVPIAGLAIGNSMNSAIVTARRLMEEVRDRRLEVEARLALGQPSRLAARPYVRAALRTALMPQIETTKAVGIVFLPGAMTGLILAGVEPIDAVLVQAVVMYLVLGVGARAATVVATGWCGACSPPTTGWCACPGPPTEAPRAGASGQHYCDRRMCRRGAGLQPSGRGTPPAAGGLPRHRRGFSRGRTELLDIEAARRLLPRAGGRGRGDQPRPVPRAAGSRRGPPRADRSSGRGSARSTSTGPVAQTRSSAAAGSASTMHAALVARPGWRSGRRAEWMRSTRCAAGSRSPHRPHG